MFSWTEAARQGGVPRDRDWLLALAALTCAIVCTALLASPTSASRETRAPEVARVTYASAAIRRRPARTLVWEELGSGSVVYARDSLFVPPGAAARVTLNDGSVLEIDENSLVVLEPLVSGGRIDLKKGSLVGATSGAQLAIQSGGGVTSLSERSEARIELSPTETRVDVFGGQAKVSGRQGEQTLSGKASAALGADGRVQAKGAYPVELFEPARNARFYFRTSPPSVRLTWDAASARFARLEIARDRGFAYVVARVPAERGDYALDSKPGLYWWRIVDGSGQPLSESRRFGVVEDVPPLLLSPRPREVVWQTPERPLLFQWTEVKGVGRYRLEVSADADFSSLAFSAEASQPKMHLEKMLPESVYHWRVRSDEPERGQSHYSKPGTFRLIHKPLPDAPEVLEVELELEGQ